MAEPERSPHIFELLACDTLKHSLRDGIRYLLDYLKQNHPGFRKLPATDETVLLLDLCIESSFLRSYKASYAENLYSLIRHPHTSKSNIEQILPSLICLTLAPYLRNKLDKYYDQINRKETKTPEELVHLRIYRLLTRSISVVNLLCILRYASGQSNYHNVLNFITGIVLKSKTLTIQDDSSVSGSYFSSKFVADFAGKALTYGSYFIQFLDFWNTHSNSTPLFKASMHIPPSPPRFSDLGGIDEQSSNICLICEQPRQNECALSNTGYVFCYTCIYKYVRTEQKCPITKNPATVDNIVRIYQDRL